MLNGNSEERTVLGREDWLWGQAGQVQNLMQKALSPLILTLLLCKMGRRPDLFSCSEMCFTRIRTQQVPARPSLWDGEWERFLNEGPPGTEACLLGVTQRLAA